MPWHRRSFAVLALLAVFGAPLLVSCGGGDDAAAASSGDRARGGSRGGGPPSGRGGFPGFGGGPPAAATAIPVEVADVERRSIADYLETNGALEAENEVDVVSRTSGPITELNVEEGDFVEKGQVLARIDEREAKAQLEIAKVNLEETRVAYERAKVSRANEIISDEAYDQAKARFESAEAQIASQELELSYTVIEAPFDGLIIERAIKFAEFVNNGSRLFRISDFDPLLCPIQVPEKDLGKLRKGQRAYITVEAFPDERFSAKVLRVNPVVDRATGTIKVTLEINGRGRLRPGMFGSVFVELDVREDTLVIPRTSLVLESLGDVVYTIEDGVATRAEVQLGYEEADSVEVLAGLAEGQRVLVVGQDAVTDGTPIYVLGDEAPGGMAPGGRPPERSGQRPVTGRPQDSRSGGEAAQRPSPEGAQGPPGVSDAARPPGGGPPSGRGPGGRPRIDFDDPEQVERVRERMRSFGLSDEQIEERLQQMKEGTFTPPRGRRVGGPPGDGSSNNGARGDSRGD